MHFALPWVAVATFCALPDIVPENMKGIAVELRIDVTALGPLAAVACLQHVVAEGETLSGIAKAHLGDARRVPEILALNPGIGPNLLRAGAKLWLPPRVTPPDDAEVVLLHAGAFEPVPRFGPLPVTGLVADLPRWGKLSLLAVPLAAKADFDTARAQRRDPGGEIAKLVKAGRLQQLDAEAPGRLVERSSPVARHVATYRIRAGGDQSAVLERVSDELFDAQGKPVQPASPGKVDSEGRPIGGKTDQGALLLVLLGAIGCGGLLLRRARATVQIA